MKIWYQHGSEHSANLVMIGHFKDIAEATRANEVINELTKQVGEDQANGSLTVGTPSDRYDPAMLELLGRLNVSIAPQEIEQFAYEVDVTIQGKDLVLTTEELDISAFLKVMLQEGARIEVYSAHNYPDSPHGRGR